MSLPEESPGAVDERLLAVLDPDPVRAELLYRDLQRQLARFFEWRRCADPEDLAQDVLLRGMRRISQGIDVYASDPRSYFFGVAYNVLKEARKPAREQQLEPVVWDLQPSPSRDFDDVEDRLLLHQVLAELSPEERRVVVEYYAGDDEDREALAETLGITRGALRVRVFRIIEQVRETVRERKRRK